MYFCRGCDSNNPYDQFEMSEQRSSPHNYIKCKICKNLTCIILCRACEQYKFKDISDQDALLSCTCGYKQRIFQCKGCCQVQCLNSQDLEQSTKIKCGSCQCSQFQINCPDCKTLNSTYQTHELITCTKCSLQFTFIDCPNKNCRKESISRSNESQYQCSLNHKFREIKCLRCKQLNYTNGQDIQCISCSNKMKEILCQCGTKQFIGIQNNQPIQKYKCQTCQLSFNLHKCCNNCEGYLSEVDSGAAQPDQTNFLRSTISLCQQCRQKKMIVKCLRCQQSTIYDDDGEIPSKCRECSRPFMDNLLPTCAICQEKPVETIFLPCNHMVCCVQCCEQIQTGKCPICRNYGEKRKVFFS